MIIFFSGTGNSRLCAELLSDELKDEIISANDFIRNSEPGKFSSDKPYIFVSPTYAWQIPHVFRDFIMSSEFSGSRDAYFVMTCGRDIGNSEKYNSMLCSKKGFNYKGSFEIVMPENYIALYDTPVIEDERKMLKAAIYRLRKKARIIEQGRTAPSKKLTISDRFRSSAVNKAFYPIMVKAKPFYAKDSCISCGKCAELCPLCNISIKDGRPVWGNNCTHCMACISYCPVEAIEYGDKSTGKRRYRAPSYSSIR